MIPSLAKEAGDVLTADSHRACSDRKYGKDEYGDGKPSTESKISSKEPIHYRCGQKRK